MIKLYRNKLVSISFSLQQPLVSQEAPKPVVPTPSEGQLVGRGRQKPAPGAMSEEGKCIRGTSEKYVLCHTVTFTNTNSLIFCLFLLVAMLQISAGFQQVKIGERGGRRRDFHDSGVHTRQLMEHVKESKTGNNKMLRSMA